MTETMETLEDGAIRVCVEDFGIVSLHDALPISFLFMQAEQKPNICES